MLFNSYVFIFEFLPLTLVCFFGIRRTSATRFAIAWLVFASFFFYGWWHPAYLVLLLFSIFFNYRMAGLIGSLTGEPKGRWFLMAAVAVDLGLLGYFKYTNFFMQQVGVLTGFAIPHWDIILPLGISFFTFQQIAFLVDVSRGESEVPGLLRYCLFVSFFPQLIAGPIVHHREMMPQFEKESTFRFHWVNLAHGLAMFTFGLFKKVVIADGIAAFATPAFHAAANGANLTFLEAWIGALAYTFQLYFDFSGYSDMAIGLGLMFGIRLPINFNSPYKANNISEFWRRWHITLSRFLRDYLYIPLGGNRKGSRRRLLNIMITMAIGGLWHGAGWTFVLWGSLHGVFLVVHRLWSQLLQRLGAAPEKYGFYRFLGRLVTFFAVCIGWVLFRAENLSSGTNILKSMFGVNGIQAPAMFEPFLSGLLPDAVTWGGAFINQTVSSPLYAGLFLTLLWAVSWFLPNTQEIMGMAIEKTPVKASPSILTWRLAPTRGWAVVVGMAAGISILWLSGESEFLYFQF